MSGTEVVWGATEIANYIAGIQFGVAIVDGANLAAFFQNYIDQGSAVRNLALSELTVYANLTEAYAGKETVKVATTNGQVIPQTIEGLLANGTKIFDAFVYLSTPAAQRPPAVVMPKPKKTGSTVEIVTYNNPAKIASSIFVVYFYFLIRGSAPSKTAQGQGPKIPSFITNVLTLTEPILSYPDYIASFEINRLDPAWVKNIKLTGLSQEVRARLGLGVAGYRFPTIFNNYPPDNTVTVEVTPAVPGGAAAVTEEVPASIFYAEQILVAKSFSENGYCWDFHPLTRHPDVLAKYGNINKNCANLIVACFKKETIENMVKIRALYVAPVEDKSSPRWKLWRASMVYTPTNKIF